MNFGLKFCWLVSPNKDEISTPKSVETSDQLNPLTYEINEEIFILNLN